MDNLVHYYPSSNSGVDDKRSKRDIARDLARGMRVKVHTHRHSPELSDCSCPVRLPNEDQDDDKSGEKASGT